jgi:hypothetical protein
MNIPDHCDRSSDMDDIAFFHKKLLCLGTDRLDNGFRQQFLSVEPLDTFVQIDAGLKTNENAEGN